MQDKLQFLIIKQLTCDSEFTNAVIHYLKPEFFDQAIAPIFKLCYNYHFTYNLCPTVDALDCELDSLKVPQEIYDKAKLIIQKISEANLKNPKIDTKWLIKQTEEFCKKKLYYNASVKVVEALDDENKQGLAIKELEDASAFTFDVNLGLNFRESFEKRFELYTEDSRRVPFGIKQFDKITNGGIFGKTLTLLLGPTGHGKSLIMGSMMAENMRNGLNVACYTFEMGDFRIAERIDANLLNTPISEWKKIGKEMYMKKAEELLDKVKGNIYIKEYPSGGAHAGHIKKNLIDLKRNHGFVPDIVYVDYVNIMGSQQLKASAKQETYIYMTIVAEELRTIAQEFDIPIISAIQTNRCICPESIVITQNGKKKIKDINILDKLLSKDNKYNTVKNKIINKNTEVYKITTESGKQIICSKNHIFPTQNGNKTIESGLSETDCIFINNDTISLDSTYENRFDVEKKGI